MTRPLDADRDPQRTLNARAHPPHWRNPQPRGKYDVLIIGGGPGGIAAAELARRFGASVALLERGHLGGNSLNAGSIPSKAIIRQARIASFQRDCAQGSQAADILPTFADIMEHMRAIRARVAAFHSTDRLQHLGIDVFFGEARFVAADAVALDDLTLQFERALIVTGARPRQPDMPGFDHIGYLTSATLFDLTRLPESLIVVGGGPVGCELAQAFCRLGSDVTIIQNDPKFLPREERDAAELLARCLVDDGVQIRLNTTVTAAHERNGKKCVETQSNGRKEVLCAEQILVSIGRQPNVETLDLAKAGIELDASGAIRIDTFLQTSNPSIYAAGDVCMSLKFTNIAQATARMAVANALRGKKLNHEQLIVPWCTYCDPEIAHIGLQVWQAREQNIPVKTYAVLMQDTDRAITDQQDRGFVKIHIRDGTDQIIGATIMASRASEMINEMSAIMRAGLGMRELSHVVHTYPAQSEAIRAAALAFLDEQDEPV